MNNCKALHSLACSLKSKKENMVSVRLITDGHVLGIHIDIGFTKDLQLDNFSSSTVKYNNSMKEGKNNSYQYLTPVNYQSTNVGLSLKMD